MGAVRYGCLLGAAAAGWPLYSLVQAGSLDGGTALARGLVVVAGCGLGAAMIGRLIRGYEHEAERARLLARREAGVVHEGTALPPGEAKPASGPVSGA